MSFYHQFRAKLNSLRRTRAERALDDELSHHLESLTEQNVHRGMSLAEAERAARIELGGSEQIKESVRDTRFATRCELLLQDARFAARMLRKQPSFTLVAVLTLALGIGANTAIFSILNAVVLRPIPYPQPEGIVHISMPEKSEDPRFAMTVISYANLLDIAQQNTVFSHVAGVRGAAFTYMEGPEPEQIYAEQVSAEMFPLLGIAPALGRTFSTEEDQRGASPVAVLSHEFWQQRLSGDPNVVGKPLKLGQQFQGSSAQSGSTYTIIGVMPPDFRPLSAIEGSARTALWLPLGQTALPLRNRHNTEAYARLKPGVTLAQARAEMQAIAARLAQAYPADNKDKLGAVNQFQEELSRESRGGLWLLQTAVGLVLLIACANVANLLLTRTTARSREIAIRMALGAGRVRLLRLLFAEGLFLALAGGALGTLLAHWGVQIAVAAYPGGIPRLAESGVDLRVLLFALLVSCITGLLFTLAPAFHAARGEVFRAMKEGSGASSSAASLRSRNFLASAEVALAVVLLAGAGLLLKSFWKLIQVPTGFATQNRMTFRVSLPRESYPKNEQSAQFYDTLLARLRSIPGVRNVAATNALPLGGGYSCDTFQRDDKRVPESQQACAEYRLVAGDYFSTMGIAPVLGRLFNERDTAAAPPVAIITEEMARRFWPGVNPIGMRVTSDTGDRRSREIVGVVRDVRHFGLAREIQPELYIPYAQDPWARGLTIVLHTEGAAQSVFPQARAEVLAMNRALPIFAVRSLEDVLRRSVAEPRFRTALLGVFAALALALAMIGTYSVMAFGVAQRTREFGIRMALGAQRADILRHVVRAGLSPLGIGLAAGVAGALAGGQLISKYLFQVTPEDPATFAAVAAMLALTGLAAVIVPAFRATRVDPLTTLRHE